VVKPASPQKHLKLYTERPPKDVRPQIEAVACVPDLLRAFQAATGWSLRRESGSLTVEEPKEARGTETVEEKTPVASTPSKSAEGTGSKSKIQNPKSKIGPPPPPAPRLPSLAHAQRLAGSIAELLDELIETRRVVWQREAELAAGVPLVPHREEEKHLAARLDAVLRAGVEAVGADAIALYLLDEATTELKLRCAQGLPFDRLAAPARPLKGAVADLEAMLGHAVVIDDDCLMRMWNVPENFPAAVCVPVSTPTTLLGTLWVFDNEKRDFNDRETNLLEIVAGRLASDLEREMLLRASTDGANLQKQLSAAERRQRNELPTLSPLLDGWSVAGWTTQADGIGGAFHDWFCPPGGLLAVAVGKAAEQGVVGALTASAAKTAVRAHARYHRQAERILQQANLTLWTGSAGDQRTALFCGLIETATGRVCCSSAGQLSLLRVGREGWQSLSHDHNSLGLGESPEADFEQFGYELQPGEALVIVSGGIDDSADSGKGLTGEAGLADSLQGKLDLSAEELVAAAREVLDVPIAGPDHEDRTVLVVKRTMA
jgi:phosphoserine phosphatase RsbU/P